MFPVTLEATDGRLQTYQTPCYGFLRENEWVDNDYDFCDGLHRVVKFPWHIEDESHPSPFGSVCLWHSGSTLRSNHNRIDLDELKYIWNSGPVVPTVGMSKDGSRIIAKQLSGTNTVVYGDEQLPAREDNVSRWSRESGISYTRREFLEALQAHIDVDNESALVFHENGFTGVRADIPADRAMFYLMVDRELWAGDNYDKTKFMLNLIHQKSLNPMIAFIMSRLISINTNALGVENTYYSGNNSDSCILPDSLIVVGLGKKYAEPTTIPWSQNPYTSGEGHLRDEDLEDLELCFCHPEFNQYVSPSLFDSIFMLKNIITPEHDDGCATLIGEDEPAVPVKTIFSKKVINERVYREGRHRYWDLGGLLETLDHSSDIVESRDKWESIIYNMLMGE